MCTLAGGQLKGFFFKIKKKKSLTVFRERNTFITWVGRTFLWVARQFPPPIPNSSKAFHTLPTGETLGLEVSLESYFNLEPCIFVFG